MEEGVRLLDDRFSFGLTICCGLLVFSVVTVHGFWLIVCSRDLVDTFSREAALSLSTITISLPFSRLVNVLSALFSTLKGPTRGGAAMTV